MTWRLLVLLCFAVASPLASITKAQVEGGEPNRNAVAAERFRDGDGFVEVTEVSGPQRFGLWREVRLRTQDGASFAGYVGRSVLIRTRDANALAQIAQELSLHVEALMPSIGLYLAQSADSNVDALELTRRVNARTLATQSSSIQCVPDFAFQRTQHSISIPPNDPRYGGQWYLNRISIESAWQEVTGERSQTIVVVDNGCESTHPDLSPNLLEGYNAIDDNNDPSPSSRGPGENHGTSCAGLVASPADNNLGIAGVCPECTVRCVKLLSDNDAPIPTSADVRTFNFALQTNAAVVSNSWGFREAISVPTSLRDAIVNVIANGRMGLGAMVVFAAGNDDRELRSFELYSIPGLITVGAINNFDEAASFSNRGSEVDITAPTGTLTLDLLGTDGNDPSDYTSLFGGTSSACPIVAGVAALLATAHPQKTGAELVDALIHSSRPAPFATPDDEGHDTIYGFGIVDPQGALDRLAGRISDSGVDAGSDGGAIVAPATKSGCGCRIEKRSSRGSMALFSFALGFLIVRLRARRIARRP